MGKEISRRFFSIVIILLIISGIFYEIFSFVSRSSALLEWGLNHYISYAFPKLKWRFDTKNLHLAWPLMIKADQINIIDHGNSLCSMKNIALDIHMRSLLSGHFALRRVAMTDGILTFYNRDDASVAPMSILQSFVMGVAQTMRMMRTHSLPDINVESLCVNHSISHGANQSLGCYQIKAERRDQHYQGSLSYKNSASPLVAIRYHNTISPSLMHLHESQIQWNLSSDNHDFHSMMPTWFLETHGSLNVEAQDDLFEWKVTTHYGDHYVEGRGIVGPAIQGIEGDIQLALFGQEGTHLQQDLGGRFSLTRDIDRLMIKDGKIGLENHVVNWNGTVDFKTLELDFYAEIRNLLGPKTLHIVQTKGHLDTKTTLQIHGPSFLMAADMHHMTQNPHGVCTIDYKTSVNHYKTTGSFDYDQGMLRISMATDSPLFLQKLMGTIAIDSHGVKGEWGLSSHDRQQSLHGTYRYLLNNQQLNVNLSGHVMGHGIGGDVTYGFLNGALTGGVDAMIVDHSSKESIQHASRFLDGFQPMEGRLSLIMHPDSWRLTADLKEVFLGHEKNAFLKEIKFDAHTKFPSSSFVDLFDQWRSIEFDGHMDITDGRGTIDWMTDAHGDIKGTFDKALFHLNVNKNKENNNKSKKIKSKFAFNMDGYFHYGTEGYVATHIQGGHVEFGSHAMTMRPAIVTYGHDRLSIDNLHLEGDDYFCHLTIHPNNRGITGRLDVKDLPLAPLGIVMPSFGRLHGKINGQINIAGTMAEPRFDVLGIVRGQHPHDFVPNWVIQTHSILGHRQAQLSLKFIQDERLATQADATLPLHFSLAPFGFEIIPHGSLTGRIVAKGDLSALNHILAFNHHGLDGALNVDFALQGSVAQPSLVGTATVDNGKYRHADVGTKLKHIMLKIQGDGTPQLKIQNFEADDGDHGTFKATGLIGMHHLMPDLSIDGTLNNFYIIKDADRSARLNGKVILRGPANKLMITLRGVIPDYRQTIDTQGDTDIVSLDVKHINAPRKIDLLLQKNQTKQKSLPSSGATYDIAVDLTNAKLYSGALDSLWGGTFMIKGPQENPQLLGKLYLKRGSYDLGSKHIIFSRGIVKFSGSSDPFISLDGSMGARGIDDYRFSWEGTASNLTFSSNGAQSQDEMMATILAGNSVDSQSKMVDQVLGLVFSRLPFQDALKGLTRAFGVNTFEFADNDDPFCLLRGMTLRVGRSLSKKIYLGAEVAMPSAQFNPQSFSVQTTQMKAVTEWDVMSDTRMIIEGIIRSEMNETGLGLGFIRKF